MNVLPFDKRVRVIATLVEGNSIRAAERLCDVNRETIMRLGTQVGEACRRLHDALVVDLQVGILEVDELWAYVGKKQKRLQPSDSPELGDSYTFLGIDANRKAIVSFVVGKRDYAHTAAFCRDLRARILGRPQITSDGFYPYIEAVQRAFGHEVDYAQIRKTYGPEAAPGEGSPSRPRRCTGAAKVPVLGAPDPAKISTSYVERVNLSLRMGTKRFQRRANGFSKKLRHHAAAVALYVAHYNFCRVHETLRTTPMMAMGVTGHVWSIAELMDAALSIAPAPAAPPLGIVLDPGQVARPADLPPIAPVRPGPAPAQLSLFPDEGGGAATSGRICGDGRGR